MIEMDIHSLWPLVVLTFFETHDCFEERRGRSYQCATWSQAMDICNPQSGHSVPVIYNKYDYDYVTNIMLAHKLNFTWLGLQRTILSEYQWLDCTKPPDIFLAQDWGGISRCVNLNVRDAQLEVSPCSFTKGVICQVPDCSLCSQPNTRCRWIEERCFTSTCASYSWEAGKALCRSQGYDMAILNNDWFPKNMIESKKYDFEGYFGKNCKHYWVGLRRQEWLYKISDISHMTNVYWAAGEPGPDGNCSVIQRSGNSFHWKAVSCNAQYPFLCIPAPDIRPTDKSTTAQDRTVDEQPKVVQSLGADFKMPISIYFAVWMSAGVAMTAALFMCGRYIIKMSKKVGNPAGGNRNNQLQNVVVPRSTQTYNNECDFGTIQMREGKPTDEVLEGLFRDRGGSD